MQMGLRADPYRSLLSLCKCPFLFVSPHNCIHRMSSKERAAVNAPLLLITTSDQSQLHKQANNCGALTQHPSSGRPLWRCLCMCGDFDFVEQLSHCVFLSAGFITNLEA